MGIPIPILIHSFILFCALGFQTAENPDHFFFLAIGNGD